MQNILKIGLAISLLLLLTSCIGSNEKKYVDSFCEIDYSNRTLMIDGNYQHFIEELKDGNADWKINYRWWEVFFQFDDLYPLLRDEELYYQNIKVDYEQLLNDIKATKAEKEAIEVESSISLSYKKGLTGCTKEINVLYYDLYETYKTIYGTGNLFDYFLDVEPDGYYSVSYEKDDTIYKYVAHVDDEEYFVEDDVRIDVERKYLGYDFIYYVNDQVVLKQHYHDYSYYHVFHDSYGMINRDFPELRYFETLYEQNSLVTVLYVYDQPVIEFIYHNNMENTYVKHDLLINKDYTDNTLEGASVSYMLLDNNIVELTYETEHRIVTYRVMLK